MNFGRAELSHIQFDHVGRVHQRVDHGGDQWQLGCVGDNGEETTGAEHIDAWRAAGMGDIPMLLAPAASAGCVTVLTSGWRWLAW